MRGWIQGDVEPLLIEWRELKDAWERSPAGADWQRLRLLAERSAVIRERGSGETLARKAMSLEEPDVFHEKFLEYLIEAGFDPFDAEGQPGGAPLDHGLLLSQSSQGNESSRRMKARCDQLARVKFAPLTRGAVGRRVSEQELDRLRGSWDFFCPVLPQDLRARWRPYSLAPRQERRSANGALGAAGAAARRHPMGPAPSER